jgi:hypothetical protein
VLLASPSAPTSDPSTGQDFVDTYEDIPTVHLIPPKVRLVEPRVGFGISPTIHLEFSATDAQSPVAYYDARYNVLPWDNLFPSRYRYPSGWQATIRRGKRTIHGLPGSEYCFSVRATSQFGATSTWSRNSCVMLPVGEEVLSAVAPNKWIRRHSDRFYLSSYAKATTIGATLVAKNVSATQLAIVAARCPRCGVIDLFINGLLFNHINTHGKRFDPDVLFVLPGHSCQYATIALMDATRHGEVTIEGLGALLSADG